MALVTIIGGGNGAYAFAGWLSAQGNEVVLADFEEFAENLKPLKRKGTIEVDGEIKGRFPVKVIDSVGEAVEAADTVLAVVPAFVHQRLAQEIGGYLKPKTKVILNPGRTGGALEVYRAFQAKGLILPVAETQSLLFACLKNGATSVIIKGVKKTLDIGVMPACATADVVDDNLLKMLPMLNTVPDVRYIDLNNIGAMFHPSISILNATRIERREEFVFYQDGVTVSVGRLLGRLDAERTAIAKAWGVPVSRIQDWLSRSYLLTEASIVEMLQKNPAYHGTLGPDSLNYRYIIEDVPTGLVPLEIFGRLLGTHTPLITALIEVAQALTGQDFRACGRNLSMMGLSDKTLAEIGNYIQNG